MTFKQKRARIVRAVSTHEKQVKNWGEALDFYKEHAAENFSRREEAEAMQSFHKKKHAYWQGRLLEVDMNQYQKEEKGQS